MNGDGDILGTRRRAEMGAAEAGGATSGANASLSLSQLRGRHLSATAGSPLKRQRSLAIGSVREPEVRLDLRFYYSSQAIAFESMSTLFGGTSCSEHRSIFARGSGSRCGGHAGSYCSLYQCAECSLS